MKRNLLVMGILAAFAMGCGDDEEETTAAAGTAGTCTTVAGTGEAEVSTCVPSASALAASAKEGCTGDGKTWKDSGTCKATLGVCKLTVSGVEIESHYSAAAALLDATKKGCTDGSGTWTDA